jgi:hypothetical protein
MPSFQPGQVWTYQTRAGEEGSRVVVFKLDEHATLGTIVHVAIEGARVRNPASPTGVSTGIAHLPYELEALTRSVVALEDTRTGEPELTAYDTWKDAFERGEAGIWTVPLAEAVAMMEQALAR